jgi:hypothetical protein
MAVQFKRSIEVGISGSGHKERKNLSVQEQKERKCTTQKLLFLTKFNRLKIQRHLR